MGEWVQLERVGERVLVYYCRTLIRELDLKSRASIVVRRWRPQSEPDTATKDNLITSPCRTSQRGSVKDVPGHLVTDVMRLDTIPRKDGTPTYLQSVNSHRIFGECIGARSVFTRWKNYVVS